MKRAIVLLSALGVLVAAAAAGPPTSTADPAAQLRVYFARDGKVATAGRSVEGDAKQQAVQALLAGPDDFERSIGMSTDIPAGTTLRSVNAADGTATVDLANGFQAGGTIPPLSAAELVFTLTQFPDVQRVTITVDGQYVSTTGDVESIPATSLIRSDFTNQTPRILFESPVPGQTVSSPLQVAGISNTWEGNVQYSVQDPGGAVVDRGFTTGGALGDWRPFSFTSTFTTQRSGLGRVILWWDSQADGAQMDTYEVPVNMG